MLAISTPAGFDGDLCGITPIGMGRVRAGPIPSGALSRTLERVPARRITPMRQLEPCCRQRWH